MSDVDVQLDSMSVEESQARGNGSFGDDSMVVPVSKTGSPAGSGGLSRRWDGHDAYLFDIDGTLLHCKDAVHYFAFCETLTRVAGRPVNLEGLPVQGKVDPGIVRDAFARAGVAEAVWRPRLPEILEGMAAHVEAHAGEFQITVMPGVREVLAHLRGRGALLGVGTGNLQRIGWAKLRACGLREFFAFGGFSDGFEDRGRMIGAAAKEARRLLGRADAAVLVVGDTPGDIEAARVAGVEVVAVATGIFAAAELAEAELVVGDLRELFATGRQGKLVIRRSY